MAKPVRQRIIDAVKAALETIELDGLGAALGAERVVIARDGLPTEFPALSIEDRGDQLLGQDGYATRWNLALEILADVEAGADLAPGDDVGSAIADAYQEVAAKLVVVLLADQQWSGLAALTELGDFDVDIVEGADPRTATTATSVRIQYATRTGDPFTAA